MPCTAKAQVLQNKENSDVDSRTKTLCTATESNSEDSWWTTACWYGRTQACQEESSKIKCLC
jgi:hypothetical protein